MTEGAIYLVRHGEASASWGEDPDPPLSERGRDEAQAAARLLHPLLSSAAPVRLLSSPLLRARETAEPLATAMGLIPEIDGRFREISAPVPIAQRQDWLRAFMRQRWDQQGPDILAWRERIVTAVDALPANTVIFTHFLVINTVVSQLRNRDETLVFWPANTSITRLERSGGSLVVADLGEEMRSRVN